MSRHKKKRIFKFADTFLYLHRRYSRLVVTLTAVASGSFSLGMYYEKVQKDKEITELEHQHSVEILNQRERFLEQKEQNMRDYFELKEKYLSNPNKETYGKKNI